MLSKRVAWPHSNRKRPAPGPIIAAPTKPSARSCVIAFWILKLPRRSSLKSSAKPSFPSVCGASNGSSPITACKKKLYTLNPKNPPPLLPTQRTAKRQRLEKADAPSLERQVRQSLADKVSGNLLGLWLLVPEHLRLGTFDLLRSWSAQLDEGALAPRLALHLVHEAALCRPTLRADRSLRHKGFELANGLPFLPTDGAIHDLLDAHTIAEAHQLQVALGKLRRASGHFSGRLLALDPHRLVSYSKRDMIQRRPTASQPATKQAQTFFLLDAETGQPICLANASSARGVPQATAELLKLAEQILPTNPPDRPLIVADVEHFAVELLDHVRQNSSFDLLVPLRQTKDLKRHYQALPQSAFTPHWAGFAIATEEFFPRRSGLPQACCRYIQRTGENPADYHFKGFCCTRALPQVPTLTADFPKRWHIEEFFRFDQDLGWKRAGTLNLNIRLGQMTLALVAQTVIHQLRKRLGTPFVQWDSVHLAKDFFSGLEGDVRVDKDTVLVTYYNAPKAQQWKEHFENLPRRLEQEGVNPRVPWLYNFKLDFRFK